MFPPLSHRAWEALPALLSGFEHVTMNICGKRNKDFILVHVFFHLYNNKVCKYSKMPL